MMDHKTAVNSMAVEKYLLDEFDFQERDAFEEHFFSCDECAKDIRAGAALMVQGKEIFELERLARFDKPAAVSRVEPRKRQWLAWLRPAFAVPAMGFMLGIVVFQNLVQVPQLHESLVAMSGPAVLPAPLYLASGSARGDGLAVEAKPDQPFVVQIDLRDGSNAAHTAELYDSSGKRMWVLPIAEGAAKDGLVSLKMPGDLPSGSYSLVLKKTGSSDSGEAGRYTFALRRS